MNTKEIVIGFVLICMALGATGCSSSFLVTPNGEGGNVSYGDLNHRLENESLLIYTGDDPVITGEAFHIERDSAFWTDAGNKSLHAIGISRLRAVWTRPNRLAGALIGVAAGLAVGASTGALIGYRSSSGEDQGLGAALGAVVGGGGGMVVGTFAGAIVPREYHYRFIRDQTDK